MRISIQPEKLTLEAKLSRVLIDCARLSILGKLRGSEKINLQQVEQTDSKYQIYLSTIRLIRSQTCVIKSNVITGIALLSLDPLRESQTGILIRVQTAYDILCVALRQVGTKNTYAITSNYSLAADFVNNNQFL